MEVWAELMVSDLAAALGHRLACLCGGSTALGFDSALEQTLIYWM